MMLCELGKEPRARILASSIEWCMEFLIQIWHNYGIFHSHPSIYLFGIFFPSCFVLKKLFSSVVIQLKSFQSNHAWTVSHINYNNNLCEYASRKCAVTNSLTNQIKRGWQIRNGQWHPNINVASMNGGNNTNK